jgi:hypothetical protein
MRKLPQLAAALSTGSKPLRSQLACVVLHQLGQRPGRNDRKRRVEIAQAHSALVLFRKALQLPLNMHRVDVDEASLAHDTTQALELEASDAPRQNRSYEARFLSRFAGSNILGCEATDRVALRNDPAATATAGDQIDIHPAISAEPDRQGGDLVEHGRHPDGKLDSSPLWRPLPSYTRHISGIETGPQTSLRKGQNR